MYAPPADRTAPSSLQPAGLPRMAADDHEFERSLLASPFFWLGGLSSILVWTGVALAVLRWA
ncbi:hypothetical protein ACPWT1_15300 [Ramlibacter sp. MMS24-I3-19]|uniref:hypothetical protein n=1 Tax=Ramlibacter sp. MMS24-I3-19 TaxID=3416606 RepID=UPI003CFEE7C4